MAQSTTPAAVNPVIPPLVIALVVNQLHTDVPKKDIEVMLQKFLAGILRGTVSARATNREKGNPHRQGVVEFKRAEEGSRSLYFRVQTGDNGTCWEIAVSVGREMDFGVVLRSVTRRASQGAPPPAPRGPEKSEAALRADKERALVEFSRLRGEHAAADKKVDVLREQQRELRVRRAALAGQVESIDASLGILGGQISAAGAEVGQAAEKVGAVEFALEEIVEQLAVFEQQSQAISEIAALAKSRGIDLSTPEGLAKFAAALKAK